MANNKIQLSNGTVLLDLSADTVTSAAHIKNGLVGHLADGTTATGTLIEKDAKSVTYNLSGGATASLTTSEVVTNQGYSVKLKAPAGFALSNVTVMMGGVDITSQVFKGDTGGCSEPELDTKTITVNGTYTALDDDLDGYSEVTVNVPTPAPNLQTKNVSYTPTTSSQSAQVTSDSGYDGLEQVNISVGAIPSEYIIPSGTKSITANGTGIDVANYAFVDVNVPSPWKLVASQEISVSTTSTSAATAATIQCGSEIATKDKIVWVHIRDTAGPRAGYFYGSDAYFANVYKANGATTTFTTPAVEMLRYNNSAYAATAGQYGVYGYSISNAGALIVRKRYNSNYSLTIDGTYKVDVYTLDLPDGLSLFE